MTELESAARQALKALEDIGDEWGFTSKRTVPKRQQAITALREALAEQAEQEPVAWAHPSGGHLSARYMKEFATGLEKETHTIPLYAAPVRTKDLSDEEILPDGYSVVTSYDGLLEFARAVIAADREKNNANNNS